MRLTNESKIIQIKDSKILNYFPDKRVGSWFLMSSPWPTLSACIFYLIFMRVIGPRLMKDREPFDLKKPMIVYNIFQIFFNVYILLLVMGCSLNFGILILPPIFTGVLEAVSTVRPRVQSRPLLEIFRGLAGGYIHAYHPYKWVGEVGNGFLPG